MYCLFNLLCIPLQKNKSHNAMGKSEKRLRFEKVASNRVQKVIDYLALIKNCANRNNYEYNEDDVEHMFNEIQKALKEAKGAYNTELTKANKTGFSFK
jgi:hypothetical protein